MKDDINLFEYSNSENYGGTKDLENVLDDIWQKRSTVNPYYSEITEYIEEDYDKEIAAKQKFITITKDGKIKSRNYVGVIRFDGQTINLLPKIFYKKELNTNEPEDAEKIYLHILWWLSYCRKLRFPISKINSKSLPSDNFFEILIYIFASYTKDILISSLYQNYEEVNNELPFVRGRLDFSAYINDNIAKARWHKLACVYDSFEIDNQFNRIIKYVSRMLYEESKNPENRKMLADIIFILDEVNDVQVTCADCEKVKLNPFFDAWLTILDYCKLFLANSVSYLFKNKFRVFAFLLPMEYIFEDFIFSFINKHKKYLKVDITAQASDEYLATFKQKPVFQLRYDMLIRPAGTEKNAEEIIVDTKYKIIYLNSADVQSENIKMGVSQSDMYQMVSYAIRRPSENICLFYPNTVTDEHGDSEIENPLFEIIDEFPAKDITIKVLVVKLPIIVNKLDSSDLLEEKFKTGEDVLKEKIKDALMRTLITGSFRKESRPD